MPVPGLLPRTVTTVTDVGGARETLSDAYTDLTVRLPADRPTLRMSLRGAEVPSVRYGELAITTADLRTIAYPCFTVCLPVAGQIVATADDTAAVVQGRDALVVSPGSRVDIRYRRDDCAVRTVQFDTDVMCAELSALLGRQVAAPPRFEFALGCREQIQHAVDLLGDGLTDSSPARPDLANRLGRVMVAALLLGQRHSFSDALAVRARFEGPRAVARVVAEVEARPMDFVTAGDLAAVAYLSVRALEEGFRRHLGVTPTGYLREVRLARAHEALVSADPDATTATAVAQDWGFAHYGRFAAEYRGRYGVGPAETPACTRSALTRRTRATSTTCPPRPGRTTATSSSAR